MLQHTQRKLYTYIFALWGNQVVYDPKMLCAHLSAQCSLPTDNPYPTVRPVFTKTYDTAEDICKTPPTLFREFFNLCGLKEIVEREASQEKCIPALVAKRANINYFLQLCFGVSLHIFFTFCGFFVNLLYEPNLSKCWRSISGISV